jgi:hypothetical protein
MTGDPWAAYTDIVTASQDVEAAIHGAPVGPALAAAAAQIRHAQAYYATAGYPALAAEAAQVAARLQALAQQTPPPPGPALYAAVWGGPVVPGTLAHLWDAAGRLLDPPPLWPTLVGLGLSLAGTAATVWTIHRVTRREYERGR